VEVNEKFFFVFLYLKISIFLRSVFKIWPFELHIE